MRHSPQRIARHHCAGFTDLVENMKHDVKPQLTADSPRRYTASVRIGCRHPTPAVTTPALLRPPCKIAFVSVRGRHRRTRPAASPPGHGRLTLPRLVADSAHRRRHIGSREAIEAATPFSNMPESVPLKSIDPLSDRLRLAPVLFHHFGLPIRSQPFRVPQEVRTVHAGAFGTCRNHPAGQIESTSPLPAIVRTDGTKA